MKLLFTDKRLPIFSYFENRLKESIYLEARLYIPLTCDLNNSILRPLYTKDLNYVSRTQIVVLFTESGMIQENNKQ